jgi:uncharacterized protein (DUF1684 family)
VGEILKEECWVLGTGFSKLNNRNLMLGMKTRIIILIVVLMGCATKKEDRNSFDGEAYRKEIAQWDSARVAYQTSLEGWLNLAGLFLLKPGVNTFGSDQGNDIVFPEGKIPAKAGAFFLNNQVVEMTVQRDVDIQSGGKEFKSGIIFHPDSARQPKLTFGSLQWFIIQRVDQLSVRLRDLQHPEIKNFKGIERYEADPAYRVEAILERPAKTRMISITNVLGQTYDQPSPGTLHFQLNGKKLSLDALEEGDELFIIFSDSTNEHETYPAGRYLYVKKPGEDGNTIIDFNKAYNPPCAFTPFATCPLPPPQNVLPLSIRAGEKNYKGYSH